MKNRDMKETNGNSKEALTSNPAKSRGKHEDVVLTSSTPVADGGRSFNVIYLITALAGLVIGFVATGGGGAVVGLFVGLILGYGIKDVACTLPLGRLRSWTFHCDREIPYDERIAKLQPQLLPLGMTIEKNKDGSPVITYKHMIYDVRYESDQTFSIWWRKSLAGAFLTSNMDTSRYRKACVAYGIIGYFVQQATREEAKA